MGGVQGTQATCQNTKEAPLEVMFAANILAAHHLESRVRERTRDRRRIDLLRIWAALPGIKLLLSGYEYAQVCTMTHCPGPFGGSPVETLTMGKVIVTAKIENVADLYNANQGVLPADQVRRVEVTDALVDTGATTLSMPKWLIAQLGLIPFRTRTVRTPSGVATFQVYAGVRLEVQGRECSCDVLEIADECPVLIGQVPLELLDFVIDPQGQRLIGNPEHGGEQMAELY